MRTHKVRCFVDCGRNLVTWDTCEAIGPATPEQVAKSTPKKGPRRAGEHQAPVAIWVPVGDDVLQAKAPLAWRSLQPASQEEGQG